MCIRDSQYLRRRLRVKRGGMLIEQKELRRAQRRHQQRQRLTLSAGKQADLAAHAVFQSQPQRAQLFAIQDVYKRQGKSTTLRAISGLQKVQSGSILYGGEELTSLPAKEIVRRGIIHVPEGRRVFPDMTVAENLKIGAFLRTDKAAIAQDMDYVYSLSLIHI